MANAKSDKKKLSAKEKAAAARAKARATKQKVTSHPATAKAKSVARRPANKLAGFANFIREKGVVGLAVGLAIGTAATAVVAATVSGLVSPTVALLVGTEELSAWTWTLHVGSREAIYPLGSLLDALIKFVAVAAVIYFVVIGLRLDRLDKKKED
ncbi:MAG: MscL family protein [Candidatus Saccharimonadales bacterium]